MSYRIRYGQNSNQRESCTNNKTALFVIAAVASLVVLACAERQRIISWLIPGDDTVTRKAFSVFSKELESGEPFGVAFEVFCREIIENG